MFDLVEESLNIQEQNTSADEEENGARTLQPSSAALFSMPEKFTFKEDAVKKKSHLIVPILSVCVVILVVASIGLAFAIQNKNLRATQEKIQQEAARLVALQAQQQNESMVPGEENIPFQINENVDAVATSTDSVTSASVTSTAPLISATSTSAKIVSASSSSSLPAVLSVTSTEEEIITFGPDFDKDKLSDIEERIFKTDPKKPDTDTDGILDGAEVKNAYDPTKGEGAALKDSGLVDTFVNQVYQYTFLYPKFPDEWAVSALDQTQKEVMASAATGEYFSIRVEDNPQKLQVLDWYTTVYATGRASEQMQALSFGSWNALMRADGRVYYLVRKDERSQTLTSQVYVLTYAPNAKKELNYLTTFQMLVKSFSPLEIVVTIQQ